MLTKEERKERNTAFWNQFRKEMRSVKSSAGKNIDWVAYPTKVKDLYLRMEADKDGARFCIDIQPKDDGIRALLYEQMQELRRVMEDEMGPGIWNEFHGECSGRNVSRIYWEQKGINFFNDDNLPQFKSFFSRKLIDFDQFYEEYKDILLALVG